MTPTAGATHQPRVHQPGKMSAGSLRAHPRSRGQLPGRLHALAAALRPGAGAAELAQGSEAAVALHEFMVELLAAPAPPGGPGVCPLPRVSLPADAHADSIVANGVGLLLQSYEATAGLIGNTLVVLATRPALRRRVGDDTVLLNAVLREVLRYDAPIQNTRRYLAHDLEIVSQHLRAGDTVLAVLAAANRGPAANRDPVRSLCIASGAGSAERW